MNSSRGLIRGHRDFRRLWIGETLSQVGTQISVVAVPLAAVLTLHASTFQVAALTAVQGLALVVIGLPAGAWVDRMPRRPVLIVGDLVRAGLLVSIPAAAAVHRLHLGQLYVVVFAVGLCTVFFDIAYQSYLPSLIGREHLVEGNGRLEASRSTAYLAGPGIAGYLVAVVTAPGAILLDAASFLWSAAWIATIRTREPSAGRRRKEPARERRSLRRDIAEGIALVVGHPVLRAFTLYSATNVLFLSMEHAIDVVFLVRTVGLAPTRLGLLYAISSVGAILGAFAAPPLHRRFGPARTILATAVIANTSMLLIPLTGAGVRLAWYVVGVALSSWAIVAYNIVCLSYRQTLCPDELLGRASATMRFLTWGTIPLGGLLGGVLATAFGLRATLWVSAVGCLLSLPWLLRSPLARPTSPQPVPAVAP